MEAGRFALLTNCIDQPVLTIWQQRSARLMRSDGFHGNAAGVRCPSMHYRRLRPAKHQSGSKNRTD